MKILIVDDSAFMRTILKDIVLKTKWSQAQIIEAGDGNDAIAKFNSEKPDLVLLDVVMPGEDGLGVLRHLGRDAQSVILISSVDQSDVIDAAKMLGAKDYITKPFDATQVVERLNSLELAPSGGLASESGQ